MSSEQSFDRTEWHSLFRAPLKALATEAEERALRVLGEPRFCRDPFAWAATDYVAGSGLQRMHRRHYGKQYLFHLTKQPALAASSCHHLAARSHGDSAAHLPNVDYEGGLRNSGEIHVSSVCLCML